MLPAAWAEETTLAAPVIEWLSAAKTINSRYFKAGELVLENIPQSLPNYHVVITRDG